MSKINIKKPIIKLIGGIIMVISRIQPLKSNNNCYNSNNYYKINKTRLRLTVETINLKNNYFVKEKKKKYNNDNNNKYNKYIIIYSKVVK